MWRITADQKLLRLSDDRPGVVWAASETLVFFRAELPERKQLWSQVVSFALEEKLLHSVDTMHFAVGVPDAGEGMPVATLPLATINHWMDMLKDNSVKPVAIYPDFMALPFDPGRVTVWHEAGRCLLRLSEQEGACDSVEWIHALLAHGRPDADLLVFSDDVEVLPEEWRASAQALPESLEESMVKISDNLLPMNLMWGQLSPASETLKWLQPWSRVAMVIFALIPLYLGDLHLKTRSLEAQTRILSKVMENTVQECSPGQNTQSGGLRSCVSRLIEKVQTDMSQAQSSLWQAMRAVDVLLSSCQPCRTEKIKLTRSRLSLDISTSKDTASVIASLEKFSRWEIETEVLADANERKQLRVTLRPKQEG